jgi:hypothetical protein
LVLGSIIFPPLFREEVLNNRARVNREGRGRVVEKILKVIKNSAPAMFYNSELRSVLVSPLNNVMVGMQARSAHFSHNLAFGNPLSPSPLFLPPLSLFFF